MFLHLYTSWSSSSNHKHVFEEHSANFTAQEFCHIWAFLTFNCDEIWWGVSCAVLTANLLPVVRYVPVFHPSEANELINLPLTPSSSSEHLFSPTPARRGEILPSWLTKTKQRKGILIRRVRKIQSILCLLPSKPDSRRRHEPYSILQQLRG